MIDIWSNTTLLWPQMAISVFSKACGLAYYQNVHKACTYRYTLETEETEFDFKLGVFSKCEHFRKT